MSLSLFDLLVIIGISQGFFTACLLLISKQDRLKNMLLALILFTFILLSCKILLHTLGLWSTDIFRYFPLAVDLTIQPLIYLFILSAVNHNYRLKFKDLLHFLPFLVFLSHAIIVYVNVKPTSIIPEKDTLADALCYNYVKSLEDFLSVLSAWIYGSLSYINVKNYRKWLNNNIGDMTYPTYSWLRNVLILFGLLMSILSINLLLDTFGFGAYNFYHWQLFYLFIAVTIYYMGVQGYRERSLPTYRIQNETRNEDNISYDTESIELAKQRILDSLRIDKVYRDPEISLTGLSEKIGLPINLVSHVTNSIIGKNFRNLVNDFRIEEVKDKMSNPKYRYLSILGIALECGFNSESSFYRVFKKVTGKSPKEFMENKQNL